MSLPVLRILVVDDESAIRRALRPPLMELGFQVAEASRGEEALQMLRTTVFDAVLLDVNMPGIGGVETLRRIRAFAPRLPILMLTVRDRRRKKSRRLIWAPTTTSPNPSAPANSLPACAPPFVVSSLRPVPRTLPLKSVKSESIPSSALRPSAARSCT